MLMNNLVNNKMYYAHYKNGIAEHIQRTTIHKQNFARLAIVRFCFVFCLERLSWLTLWFCIFFQFFRFGLVKFAFCFSNRANVWAPFDSASLRLWPWPPKQKLRTNSDVQSRTELCIQPKQTQPIARVIGRKLIYQPVPYFVLHKSALKLATGQHKTTIHTYPQDAEHRWDQSRVSAALAGLERRAPAAARFAPSRTGEKSMHI